MYGIVLMAAVSGGPDVSGADTPVAVVAAPVSYGCTGAVVHSGYGCSAPVAYSCYGSSCYGRGYGCGASVAMPAYKYGCGAVAPTYGCYGSCTGTVAYGASCMGSSCYGSSCHGAVAAGPAKHGFLGVIDRMRARRAASADNAGGSGCYGSSCHGTVAHSYGCSGAVTYSAGCYGGVYSSGAVWGAAVHTGVVGEKVISEKAVTPGTGTTGGAAMPDPKKGTDAKDKGTTTDPKKTGGNEEGANIKFQLPAAAKLFVDGRLTSGEGTERAFFTPPLAAGQKFFYDVKAEIVVDGKTVVEEKRVIVQAGAELRETFPKLLAAAGNPSSVASK